MTRPIAILAVLTTVVFGQSELVNAAEPVAHWKLDEAGGMIAYDSAGDNHGTLVNGPLRTTGIIDGALDFDGVNDSVDVGDPPDGSLDFGTSDFTLSVWFKTSMTAPGFLVAKRAKGYYAGYDFYIQEGIIFARIADGSSVPDARTTETFDDGLWHHAAAVYDRDNVARVYVDGVSKATSVGISSIGSVNNNEPFTIGDRNDPGHHYPFNGLLDDVRIYNRALSAAEIEELYLGEEPELVGLEITGPDEVPEDSQTQYSAIAHYDNNSTRDVTDLAVWSVEPDTLADIDESGLLTTPPIYYPTEDITIYAQYTQAGNTFDAEKPVSILAICPYGSALDFDGVDDYVDLDAHIGDYQNLSAGTVSVWLNNIEDEGGIFFSACRSDAVTEIYFAILSDGRLKIRICPLDPPGSLLFWISDDALPSGWHHFVYSTSTSPSGNWMYLDGEPVSGDYTKGNSSTNAFFSHVPNQDNLRIANILSRGMENREHFNGLIDDVAIYNRALTAEEIQTLMHTKLTGSEDGLVGCWNLDEGEGQIVYDLSPNANHGQLGSDPDIDDSDPAWVDSDAPIGICTPEGLVERNVNEALEIKLNILDEILEALTREDASVNILDDLFDEARYGHLDKRDIIKAKQEIHSAIQGEEQAIDSLEKSAGDLEDSLEALSGDDTSPESPPQRSSPPGRQSKTLTKPAPSAVRKPSRR